MCVDESYQERIQVNVVNPDFMFISAGFSWMFQKVEQQIQPIPPC